MSFSSREEFENIASIASQPILGSASSANSSNSASSSSYRPGGTTFFVPTLEILAGTQIIQSLGGQKVEEFLLQNPSMEQPLIPTLEYLNSLAAKAAQLLLHGDTVTTEGMVVENPAILSCVVEAKDRRGNKVKGTLLQIAALAGDCNIQDKKPFEVDHGMVERLKTYYLHEKEAIKQLKATRPPGWEQATATRMQPYMNAVTEFLHDIVNTPQVANSSFEALKAASAAHITKFRNTLASIPSTQRVITTGLIFDPQVFVKTIDDLLVKNANRLGWYSDKTDLFAIVGFGGLQMCASACDLQAIRKGLYFVIEKGHIPDRSLHFGAGIPRWLTGCGDSFFIDILANKPTSTAFYIVLKKPDRSPSNYVRTKAAVLQRAMQQPDNDAKNRCVIL